MLGLHQIITMARSVSTHRYAVETVYLSFTFGDDSVDYSELPDDQQPDYNDFDDFLLDLRQVLNGSAGAPGGKGFPSLRECDRWQDREDHVILENERGEISVSEYCGCIAVCLAPRDPNNALDQGWCGSAAKSFVSLLHGAFSKSAMISKGRASNGEQFFELASVPGSVITSKEGRLPMFP